MKSGAEILIVSEDFPPNAGGIAQWAWGITNGLHKLGRSVCVFTRYFERLGFKEGTPYPVEYVFGRHWRRLRTLYWWKALRAYLRASVSPRYIIATTWNCSRALLGLKRKYSFKLVTVIHGLEITRPLSRAKRAIARATFTASDLIVCVSAFTAEALHSFMNRRMENVFILPNGVDYERFKPIQDNPLWKIHPRDGNLNLVTISRVIERKGHDLVLLALPQILEQVPKLKYYIVGPYHEDFRQKLESIIAEYNLTEHVVFTGLIDEAELVHYYNLADVYIMVSRKPTAKGDTEGFGITFLEANACEIPVIGSISGGIVDAIIDGQTGLLIPADDVEAIAEAVIKLMNDAALREKLGRQGRKRVICTLNWAALSRTLDNALNKL